MPSPRPDRLLHTYLTAFDRWATVVRRQRRVDQPGSVEAYRALWMALVKWAVGQSPPVTLEGMTREDLARFVARRQVDQPDALPPSPRHVWRLLNLIDRVQCQHAQPPNRAAQALLLSNPEWLHANAAHKDPLPEHLTAAQARELVNFLSASRPRPGRPAAGIAWQDLRNRTAVALHLGAGVAPGEVRALQLQAVVIEGGPTPRLPWKLVVPALGDSAQRETPLASWAGHLLRHWLDVRTASAIGGVQLFPSTRSGKPWSKVSHYLAVREVLAAAGLGPDAAIGGSYRLRHTFALRQLRRGRPPAEVARWLGVELAEVERYQRVIFDPLDDIA